MKLNRYKDDILFYMFYTNVGDVLQLAAAAELYNRDWRWGKHQLDGCIDVKMLFSGIIKRRECG